MTARSEMQLEKLIDEATRKKDSQLLEKFLATEDSENASYKCSKQFVNKLDKLLCRAIKMVSLSFFLYMVKWFEKLKGILILRGNEKNEMLTSLAEDFFNVLLAVCESRPEDYDMQVAITEALCRMISEKQRGELASQWFSMEFVSNAFKGIKDSEFETLQIPLDENLEEFWIDFNVGSKSISFYVAADDAGHQWETVIIPEEEVNMYSLEEKDSKKLLTIDLKSPMNVGNLEGEKFSLYFNSILEIKDVTRKIYGFSKCKDASKKQTASIAKTAVHVLFDESGSQVTVPESQLSPGLKEKSEEEEKPSKKKSQQLPGSLRTQNKNNSQEKCRGDSSKKPKSKEVTDAAKSLISKISDRYRDKSDEKSKARGSLGFNRDDVYNFNISGFDEPTIKLGTRNNQDKKHLFSDTDTENRGEDSKTEISWLQESKSKPKAQIVDYSRNKRLGKPISTDKNCVVTADESPEPAFHMEKPKGKSAKKKKKLMNGVIKDYKQPKVPQVVPVEPKRGDNCVQKPPEKPRNPAEQKEVEMPSAESPASLETMRCAEGLSEGNVTPEHTSSGRSLDLQESSPENREMLNSEKGISPANFSPQNKNIQSIRVNQSPEATVTKSTFGRKSFSPVLTEASLLSLTTYKTISGKNSKGAGLETCNSNEGSSFQRCFSDTLPAKGKPKDATKAVTKSKEELSFTSYKTDSGKHAKGAVPETGNNNEDPSFQYCFSDTFSVKGKLQDTTKAVTKSKEGCEPPSPLSASSGSKAQSSAEEPYDPRNESGPTVQAFLKRRTRQLDKFHITLIEELENFEKDSQSLKNMEKEFLVCILTAGSWGKVNPCGIHGLFMSSLTLDH
ncbi:hypothetical protein BTVI_72430 [Pitangus sulphuratus]|nr:hypothetical protein BTVI_72430 [Pitangus sulphuratus]